MSKKERPAVQAGLGHIRPVLIGVLTGIIVCIACLLLFSVLLSSQNMPQMVVGPMSTFAAALGGLCAGFVCARMVRTKGLLYGLICGAILSLVMMLVSFGFSDGGLGIPALFKAVFILLSSCIGGIMGINTRSSRKKAPKPKRK